VGRFGIERGRVEQLVGIAAGDADHHPDGRDLSRYLPNHLRSSRGGNSHWLDDL
jgi:hypothetical protein